MQQNRLRSHTCLFFLITALALACSSAVFAQTRARVVFVGDIMAHKEQLEAAKKGNGWDFSPQFRRVLPLFDDALVVGNFETVLAGEKAGYAGYPSFNAPDELARDLKRAGFNVVSLANNHILDRGASGATRTLGALDKAGILHVGVAKGKAGLAPPLLVEHGGLRWVFVSYSYGSNRLLASSDVRMNVISDEAILKGFAQARQLSPDILIATMHWGNEYQHTPTKRQREVAALSLKQGAHMVIGTHPHVLQPVQMVKEGSSERVIAYSLGNFVSFQRTRPRERSGVLAVDVVRDTKKGKTRIERVSIAPTRVSVTYAGGRRLFQVLYAGESKRFNHNGISMAEVKTAQQAGRAVLNYLGASPKPDERGFYTLWEKSAPHILPKSRSKEPM